MQHTKAIAIKHNQPFSLALVSAKNAFFAIVNFMYGTPERTNVTFLFALGMALIGGLMFNDASQQVCVNS